MTRFVMYSVFSLHRQGQRENGKGSSRCGAEIEAIADESAPAHEMCHELEVVRLCTSLARAGEGDAV